MDNDLQRRIAEAVREEISIVSYDPSWPLRFEEEAHFLRRTLPPHLLGRIEHFGSTAVPGLAAKPIVDMLIEVSSLQATCDLVVPLLAPPCYDYFWRTDVQPPYPWFIKRGPGRIRTHHLHFAEPGSALWERLLFRDYLRLFPDEADAYGRLKIQLAQTHPHDRVAYAEGKTAFILALTEKAKRSVAGLDPLVRSPL